MPISICACDGCTLSATECGATRPPDPGSLPCESTDAFRPPDAEAAATAAALAAALVAPEADEPPVDISDSLRRLRALWPSERTSSCECCERSRPASHLWPRPSHAERRLRMSTVRSSCTNEDASGESARHSAVAVGKMPPRTFFLRCHSGLSAGSL